MMVRALLAVALRRRRRRRRRLVLRLGRLVRDPRWKPEPPRARESAELRTPCQPCRNNTTDARTRGHACRRARAREAAAAPGGGRGSTDKTTRQDGIASAEQHRMRCLHSKNKTATRKKTATRRRLGRGVSSPCAAGPPTRVPSPPRRGARRRPSRARRDSSLCTEAGLWFFFEHAADALSPDPRRRPARHSSDRDARAADAPGTPRRRAARTRRRGRARAGGAHCMTVTRSC